MCRISFGDSAVTFDDRQVLVVVVRGFVTIVVAAHRNDAIVRERVDNDNLVVDHGVASLVQLLGPLLESVTLRHASGMDDAIILGQLWIAFFGPLDRRVAAVHRGVKFARCGGFRYSTADEERWV